MSDKRNRPANDRPGQQATTRNGNNYQAGGDIHFHTASDKKRPDKTKWLGTTQSVVTIFGGILTIIVILIFTIPKEMRQRSIESVPKDSLQVSGIIRAKATQEGISNAFVITDLDFHDTIRTTSDGSFRFTAHDSPGKSIRVYAWADHYALRNEFHTLGSPIEIELDKK